MRMLELDCYYSLGLGSNVVSSGSGSDVGCDGIIVCVECACA